MLFKFYSSLSLLFCFWLKETSIFPLTTFSFFKQQKKGKKGFLFFKCFNQVIQFNQSENFFFWIIWQALFISHWTKYNIIWKKKMNTKLLLFPLSPWTFMSLKNNPLSIFFVFKKLVLLTNVLSRWIECDVFYENDLFGKDEFFSLYLYDLKNGLVCV